MAFDLNIRPRLFSSNDSSTSSFIETNIAEDVEILKKTSNTFEESTRFNARRSLIDLNESVGLVDVPNNARECSLIDEALGLVGSTNLDDDLEATDIQDEVVSKHIHEGAGNTREDDRHDHTPEDVNARRSLIDLNESVGLVDDLNNARECSLIDEALGLVGSTNLDDDFEATDIQDEVVSKHIHEEGTSTGNTREDDRHDHTPEDVEGGETSNVLLAIEAEKRLEVGSKVEDELECYKLYLTYAHHTGFSVRCHNQRFIGTSNVLKWKEYVCSAAGKSDQKSSIDRNGDYRKLVRRSVCTAKIRVSRVGEKWRITKFEKNHNHPLVDPDQRYLLRSSRKLVIGKQIMLEDMHSSGIPLARACVFMEKMCGGLQNTGFMRKDAYDHFQKKRRVTTIQDGDAMALVEYLLTQSNSDPFFFSKVQKDDDGRLMNIFIRDGRCAHDYKSFGDVISLDTTGGTNRYKLSCAPFVGVNHHGKNVMLGIGFLSDERAGTFQWLLESFVESMDGIAPKLIYTDQCKALMNAIDTAMPETVHRLCHWHINRNAKSHFGSLAGDAGFMNSWNDCMKGVETEAEFESLWESMMNSYNIVNKDWFRGMYGLRRRWASVFSKDVFTASLLATSRSECTNNVLKQYVKSTGSLYDFVREYENIQTRWRALEREEDTHNLWRPGQIVKSDKLMSHAATVYTRSIYSSFQHECTESLGVFLNFETGVRLPNGDVQFKAKRNVRERTIVFNLLSNSATCSCAKWERSGILCCHILKIYKMRNVDAIPEPYILKRWTKKAKSSSLVQRIPHPKPSGTLSSMQFLHDITRMVFDLGCTDDAKARKDISETLFALRDRVLLTSSESSRPSRKNKRRKLPETHFLDPKMVEERREDTEAAQAAKKLKKSSKPPRKSENVTVRKSQSRGATQ